MYFEHDDYVIKVYEIRENVCAFVIIYHTENGGIYLAFARVDIPEVLEVSVIDRYLYVNKEEWGLIRDLEAYISNEENMLDLINKGPIKTFHYRSNDVYIYGENQTECVRFGKRYYTRHFLKNIDDVIDIRDVDYKGSRLRIWWNTNNGVKTMILNEENPREILARIEPIIEELRMYRGIGGVLM
jgi:hypothetical protein